MNSLPRQAFILSHEIIKAISLDEAFATWEGMKTLGINNPPYESFDILLPPSQVLSIKREINGKLIEVPADHLVYRTDNKIMPAAKPITLRITKDKKEWFFYGNKPLIERLMLIDPDTNVRDQEMQSAAEEWVQLLIVLLATKNVKKEIKENKSVKLGIGKNKHQYVTTLHIGRIQESTVSNPTGLTLRPHLRRGHIRRQHYGPNREYIKQIWIDPIFVNADENWINDRQAYNVKF